MKIKQNILQEGASYEKTIESSRDHYGILHDGVHYVYGEDDASAGSHRKNAFAESDIHRRPLRIRMLKYMHSR